MVTSFENRPNKDYLRRIIAEKCPVLKTALLLPGRQCLDLQVLLDKGKINNKTRLFIAENESQEAYDAMVAKINSMSLGTNIAEAHFGPITDLKKEVFGKELDLVNLDLCGCLGIETLKWINEEIAPALTGIFSATYSQTYRTYDEVPLMLEVLTNQNEIPPDILSYARFRSEIECQYIDYKNGIITEKKLSHIQMYITQYHYILNMIFNPIHQAKIHYQTYNDSQTLMSFWLINPHDKHKWVHYDSSFVPTILKFPEFQSFYEAVNSKITPPNLLNHLLEQLETMKRIHFEKEMQLLERIRSLGKS